MVKWKSISTRSSTRATPRLWRSCWRDRIASEGCVIVCHIRDRGARGDRIDRCVSQSKGKRASLSHLTNFNYAPRGDRSHAGGGGSGGPFPLRRSKSSGDAPEPLFTRERFLQANFRFVVRAAGDYRACALDPDWMVDWGDVRHVCLTLAPAAPLPTCPVCLDEVHLPVITRCGHLFCLLCILRHCAELCADPAASRRDDEGSGTASASRSPALLSSQSWPGPAASASAAPPTALATTSATASPATEAATATGSGGAASAWASSRLIESLRPPAVPAAAVRASAARRPRPRPRMVARFRGATACPVCAESVEEPHLRPVSVHQLSLPALQAALPSHVTDATSLCHFVRVTVAGGVASIASDATRVVDCVRSIVADGVQKQLLLCPGAGRDEGAGAGEVVSAGDRRGAPGAAPQGAWGRRTAAATVATAASAPTEPEAAAGASPLEPAQLPPPPSLLLAAHDAGALFTRVALNSTTFQREAVRCMEAALLAVRGDLVADPDTSSSWEALLAHALAWVARERGRIADPSECADWGAKAGKGTGACPGAEAVADRGAAGPSASVGRVLLQSCDGQHLFLHPLNVRCLLGHHGTYDALPAVLSARPLESEAFRVTPDSRKRMSCARHLPVLCEVALVECDLRPVLPRAAFAPFLEEITRRAARRRAREQATERARQRAQQREQERRAVLDEARRRREESEAVALVADPAAWPAVRASTAVLDADGTLESPGPAAAAGGVQAPASPLIAGRSAAEMEAGWSFARIVRLNGYFPSLETSVGAATRRAMERKGRPARSRSSSEAAAAELAAPLDALSPIAAAASPRPPLSPAPPAASPGPAVPPLDDQRGAGVPPELGLPPHEDRAKRGGKKGRKGKVVLFATGGARKR